MQEKKSSSVDWEAGFKIIKKALGVRWQKDVAQRLGITDAAISDAKSRGVVPWSWVKKTEELTRKKWEIIAREQLQQSAPGAASGHKSVEVAHYEDLPPQVGMTTSDNKLVLLVTIPVLGTVPAGIPQDISGVMSEYAEDYISISGVPSGSLGLRVGGDSMTREDGGGIHQGDVVVFLPERRPTNRCIVVVNTESGESVLRRYIEEEGRVFLDADNPRYERIEPNGGYRVVGVVIRAVRDVPLT